MVTCPKCGNPVEKGDAFCENCGFNLSESAHRENRPRPVQPQRTAKPVKQAPKSKDQKDHRWLFIAISAIVIALVALGFIAYLTGFLSVIITFSQTILGYVYIGSEGFWLVIALAFVVILIVVWNRIAPRVTRTIRSKDYQRERQITGQMLEIKTSADKAQLQKVLKKHLRLKYFFPRTSDPGIWHCHHPGKPLVAGRGDEFTACIYFDDSKVGQTVLYLEFLRWREKNGVTRKRGLKAMQQYIDNVWSIVKSTDPSATRQAIER